MKKRWIYLLMMIAGLMFTAETWSEFKPEFIPVWDKKPDAEKTATGGEDRITGSANAHSDRGNRFTNSIGMEFVYIPPGEFMMGSPTGEAGRTDDEKQHRVTLTKGFYMQTTEVTQGQWEKVMWRNRSSFKACGENCPVENVSWNDAQKFIKKLNRKEKTNKYRLPTEAEWEYACRAGSSEAFANGGIQKTNCGNEPNLAEMGWYCGNAVGRTHPVGQKQPNTYGLYDMHGNVWEWCEDWHGEYPSAHVKDPTGPSSGSYRVLRGGSWNNGAGYCRSAIRYRFRPGNRFNNLGFRLVCLQAGNQ